MIAKLQAAYRYVDERVDLNLDRPIIHFELRAGVYIVALLIILFT